jgi:hypothetical protein
MRKLGFLGATRLTHAQTVLATVIEQWREQWCFSDARLPVAVTIDAFNAAEALTELEALDWQRAEVGNSQLRCSGAWNELIYGVHTQDVPADATARHLLAHAQLALVNGLLEALGHEPATQLLSGVHSVKNSPLSSELLIQLSTAKAALYLLIDADLLNSALPVRTGKSPLVERKAAIGGARLKLHVQLPLTHLPIEDVQDIKVGDILLGDASLGAPLQIATAPTQVVAKGYLARQKQHLAIQLVSRNTPEV